jgi:hypothetical protein
MTLSQVSSQAPTKLLSPSARAGWARARDARLARWVAAFGTLRDTPIATLLLPTGGGQTRKLTTDNVDCRNVVWLPDSKGLLITAKEAGKPVSVYLQPVEGEEPRALTPEEYAASKNMVAPHGKTSVARRPADGKRFLKVSVADQWWRKRKRDSGTGAGRCDGALVRGWAIEKTLLITRVDVATRKRQVVKEWTPADRAGVTGYDSADFGRRKTFVCSFNRIVEDLFLVHGLK